MKSPRAAAVFAFTAAALLVACNARGQQVQSEPGHFDFYELNMSWAPEFCSNMNTLTPQEKSEAGRDTECSAPHGFVLHGLWPQNFNGTYPASCATRPGPVHPERNLDMTPNIALLKHEWAKHGTCTTLSPEGFFATARQAYTSVVIPGELKRLDHEVMLQPGAILTMFYRSNPNFPQGSFSLSCGQNRLTAVEACFSKDTVQPIACQGLRSCGAATIKVAAPNDSGIVM
jgi:ribonuclease T2